MLTTQQIMPAGILRTSKLFPGGTFCHQRNAAGRIVVPQIAAAELGLNNRGTKPLDERTSAKPNAKIPIPRYGLTELGSFTVRLLGFMRSLEYQLVVISLYRTPRIDT